MERLYFQVGGTFFALGFRAVGEPNSYRCRKMGRSLNPGAEDREGSAPSQVGEFAPTSCVSDE